MKLITLEVHLEEQEGINLEGIFFIKIRNYGPTIAVGNEAHQKGHQQVLWLWNGKVGEIGSSNIFFVLKDKQTGKRKVLTPELEDLVLPGITRDSIIVSHFDNLATFTS